MTEKVALITAGDSGMGADAARRLAADGFQVGWNPWVFPAKGHRIFLDDLANVGEVPLRGIVVDVHVDLYCAEGIF